MSSTPPTIQVRLTAPSVSGGKWWECQWWDNDNSTRIRWGKIGATGASQIKIMHRRDVEKLIQSKLDRTYSVDHSIPVRGMPSLAMAPEPTLKPTTTRTGAEFACGCWQMVPAGVTLGQMVMCDEHGSTRIDRLDVTNPNMTPPAEPAKVNLGGMALKRKRRSL